MPERSGYAAGVPSWVDVAVPDLDQGKAFYGGLFEWSFETSPQEFGSYTMCEMGGRQVAGMMPIDPEVPQPSMWNVYLASDDVDATAEAATAAGGTIVAGPRDVSDFGRMLFVTDPTGASIGFWQAGRHRGAQLIDAVGAACWHELVTREPLIADSFYKALFSYKVEDLGEGEQHEAAVYKVDGTAAAGRMRMSNEWPRDMASHWMTYFGVADTDESAQRARDLGGDIPYGPVDSPYGRFASCTDPFGAHFSIITPSSPSMS